MLKIVLRSKTFFLAGAILALALRLFFVFKFPSITADSFIYGDIAKNWLQHGIYGITSAAGVSPTYIRLPGYPAFLAAIFAIFGMENYRAVLIVQAFVDVGTCFVVAGLARRTINERAAKAAFLLCAICPFLVNYSATALTETLEVFFTALSLNFAVAGLESGASTKSGPWIRCGLATAAAILLRPDGGILLASIELYLLWLMARRLRSGAGTFPLARTALIVLMTSAAPLLPWTVRNLQTMHRLQPLAPRYANEENEFVPMGFNRWVKTWIADYASVEEIYWPIPGDQVDAAKLPSRAFDSLQERAETIGLLAEYNSALHISPGLDAKFGELASQRVTAAPVRYYCWLPALRIADMWLRPRTELLPSDSRWWEFNDDPKGSWWAIGLGLIGILYVGTALGSVFRGQMIRSAGLLLSFIVMRSLFLGSLENPEPRYTLECFPALIVFAAAALQAKRTT